MSGECYFKDGKRDVLLNFTVANIGNKYNDNGSFLIKHMVSGFGRGTLFVHSVTNLSIRGILFDDLEGVFKSIFTGVSLGLCTMDNDEFLYWNQRISESLEASSIDVLIDDLKNRCDVILEHIDSSFTDTKPISCIKAIRN